MNLLILGGTKFVGRHITSTALMRGHQVTLFNRGQTNAGLFPDVEKISGNRDGGLEPLQQRKWDAVIDVNGYLPRIVGASAALLADAVDRYIFVSTLSVFADFSKSGQTEDSPIANIQDPTTEIIDGDTYGALKAVCEQRVHEFFPHRALILRPGYVVGPHDHTDRMTSWWRRIVRGGEMLAPGSPDSPIQFVDGRDLAAFTIDMTERHATGTYNTHGFATQVTWGECFAKALAITGANTEITWVDESFLQEESATDSDLPMFAGKQEIGVFAFNNHKALAAGMQFRPITDTIRDTLLWDASEGNHRLGLPPAREQELLRAWHSRSNSYSVSP